MGVTINIIAAFSGSLKTNIINNNNISILIGTGTITYNNSKTKR